jgi:hypothetical protein
MSNNPILTKDIDRYNNRKKTDWRTIGVRIRNSDLPILNIQLDRLNYSTLGDLVKDLVNGKITRVTEDQQIDIMNKNMQGNGQITNQSGKPFDFYKQINLEEFLQYMMGKYQERTARCYLSYFDKYAGIFFGFSPDAELFKLKPHKRSWILQSVKRFGDFYYRRYNNREVTQLIRNIIERFDLNKNLDMKDKIYLVSPNFIEEKIKKIFEVPGELGFTIRIGLLSGLREQEIIYIKEKPVCDDGYGCDCEKLHIVKCINGMIVISIGWTRGNKKALATILPISYWNKLRALKKFDYNDISAAHRIMKRDVGIPYIAMRKIHFNVMRFKDMLNIDEAEVLAGRFKSVSARYYILHDPEKLAEKYFESWKNFGINLNQIKSI